MTTYVGSCHCGRVRFEVVAEIDHVRSCDCSVCSKRLSAQFSRSTAESSPAELVGEFVALPVGLPYRRGLRARKVQAGHAWGCDLAEATQLFSGLTIVSIEEHELDGPNISRVLVHKHNFEFVARK